MAPELENHWFERTGRGWCAKATSWQGRLLTILYTSVVTSAAWLLVDRSILGLAAVLILATLSFIWIAAVKSRDGLGW
jgi:hypothetical protein